MMHCTAASANSKAKQVQLNSLTHSQSLTISQSLTVTHSQSVNHFCGSVDLSSNPQQPSKLRIAVTAYVGT